MIVKRTRYRRRARKRLAAVGDVDRDFANDLGDVAALMERDIHRMIWRERLSRRNLVGVAVVLAAPATLAGYVLVAGVPR